jgi:competence protein ComFC
MVYQMKFDSSRAMARLIAGKLYDTVPFVDFEVVTYLPSASSRVRNRGYDHAGLIAKTFARRRGLFFERLLVRHGQARQLGASRAERKRQAEATYFAKRNLNYENVLLIDDVISSGASLEAATKVLRRAGVKNVYAAVFARR